MRKGACGEVWKIWLYVAATVALGAWISPLLYNTAKALEEVSRGKTTNGFLDWLAGVCRAADYPQLYGVAMLLAAVLLFLPWLEWLHARRGAAVDDVRSRALQKNPRAFWHVGAGFVLVVGPWSLLGLALIMGGIFTWRHPTGGMVALVAQTLAGACVLAVMMEAFFRGLALGIFLRAMRPAAALATSAALFALALAVIPAVGVNVADPDAPGTGFELLGKVIGSFADWRILCSKFIPLLALGVVLAYARWRTQSLWLSIGLHTGWLFSKGIMVKSITAAGGMLQQGLIPLAAILCAGAMAHFLISNRHDETPHPA